MGLYEVDKDHENINNAIVYRDNLRLHEDGAVIYISDNTLCYRQAENEFFNLYATFAEAVDCLISINKNKVVIANSNLKGCYALTDPKTKKH